MAEFQDFVEPHENVLIGNFLYGLGMSLGIKGGKTSSPGCINLLQQTPNDSAIGDLLTQHDGVMRIIEFKRSSNQSDKELKKRNELAASLGLGLVTRAPELVALEEISLDIHWFVSSQTPDPFSVNVRAVPYLDHTSPNCSTAIDWLDFIDGLVNEVVNRESERFSKEQQRLYLRFLIDVQKKQETSAGGMVVHLDTDAKLTYIPVRDFRELDRSLKDVIADYRKAYPAPPPPPSSTSSMRP